MGEQLLTGPTTLSADKQLQLESYKEQTASWRHLDNLLYRTTTIILPLSIAALGLPYVNTSTVPEMPEWMPIAGGLWLMIFWIASCEIVEIRAKIRFEIIHEIEDELGIVKGHKEWTNRRTSKWTNILRSHYLRRIMFGLYFGAAVALLIFFIFF